MIYLKEVLPNPIGRDTEGEWIKLANQGNEIVNFDGWYLKDEGGKTFNLTGKKINPFGEVTLSSGETKISLNNTKDSLTIYDSDGKLVDRLVYDGVGEAEIIVAKRLEEEKIGKSQAVVVIPQVLKDASINANYEWWPLLLGIILSIVVGIIGGLVFKKITIPS